MDKDLKDNEKAWFVHIRRVKTENPSEKGEILKLFGDGFIIPRDIEYELLRLMEYHLSIGSETHEILHDIMTYFTYQDCYKIPYLYCLSRTENPFEYDLSVGPFVNEEDAEDWCSSNLAQPIEKIHIYKWTINRSDYVLRQFMKTN